MFSFVETCYRHPSRETAVSCSNCGRPICPDCMTPTSVGMRCPECVKQKTRVVRRGYAPGEPIVTYTLIAVNVLAFIGAVATGASLTGGALGGPNSVLAKSLLFGPLVKHGDFWRVITAGFMHYGFFHLLFNMYALYIVGPMLEGAVGRARFALIYAVSLIAGSVGVLIVTPNAFTAGASGAVFGIMGATILVMRARGIDPMQSGLGVWLLLNLVITFSVSHISIGGHIGGLIGGGIAAWLLVDGPTRLRLPANVTLALVALLGVAAFVGALAIA